MKKYHNAIDKVNFRQHYAINHTKLCATAINLIREYSDFYNFLSIYHFGG